MLPQFPRVMYGDFSCYHSLYGFAVRIRIVLHALWESPIPGTENILSMVPITSHTTKYVTFYASTNRLTRFSTCNLPITAASLC